MKNIYIIGVGLIGGSLALDVKSKYPNVKVFGIDNNETHLEDAIALNVIDAKATYNDLQHADMVILSIPVDAAVRELPKVLDVISDTTLVIDVGSTKKPVCEAVEHHSRRRNFLATHPIAGTEFSGPKQQLTTCTNIKPILFARLKKQHLSFRRKLCNCFQT